MYQWLHQLLSLFNETAPVTEKMLQDGFQPGYTPEEVDPRVASYEQIFMGGKVVMGISQDSRDVSALLPPFAYQGWIPSCTQHMWRGLVHALNMPEGRRALISRIHGFIASGGSLRGNSLQAGGNLGRKQGFVFEVDSPYPDLNKLEYDDWPLIVKQVNDVSPEAIERGEVNKISNFSFIDPNNLEAMKVELDAGRPVGAAGQVFGNWYHAEKGFEPYEGAPWHAFVIAKLFANGTKLIFDSLTQTNLSYSGFHLLPADYPVPYIMSVRDLPDDWRAQQALQLETEFPNVYVRYGKPRASLQVEQAFAIYLRQLVEQEKDKGIRTLAGKYWVVLVNASFYGNYSWRVTANGRDYLSYGAHGSDLANALYHYRRHGVFPFDFNQPKS